MEDFYGNNVMAWSIDAHRLMHFDGNTNARKVLKAVNRWLKESEADVVEIRLKHEWDSDYEGYIYTATVEHFDKNW